MLPPSISSYWTASAHCRVIFRKWIKRILTATGVLIIVALLSLCIYPWPALIGGRPMFCHWSREGFSGWWIKNVSLHDQKHCWIFFDDELCILVVLANRHQVEEYPNFKRRPGYSVFEVNSCLVDVNSDEANRLIVLYDSGKKVEFVLEPARYWKMKNQIINAWDYYQTDSLAQLVADFWDGPDKDICKQVLGVK